MSHEIIEVSTSDHATAVAIDHPRAVLNALRPCR